MRSCIIILFLVILLCLFFKYYLSKFLCIKTNLLEGVQGAQGAGGSLNDAALATQFTLTEEQIGKINGSINSLIAEIKEENKKLNDTAVDVIEEAKILESIKAKYKQLEDYYKTILDDNTEQINLQNNQLSNSAQSQKSINTQIETIYAAENTCIAINETAQLQKTNIEEYHVLSKTAAEKGLTDEVNKYNGLIDQAVKIITDSKAQIENYAKIANSLTATVAYDSFKNASNASQNILTESGGKVTLSEDVKIAYIKANETTNKISEITKTTDIKISQEAIPFIQERVDNTYALRQTHPESANIANAHEICKNSLLLANIDLTNDKEIKFAKDAVKNIRTALIDTEKGNDERELAYLKTYIQIPKMNGLMMHYQMNKNDGNSVKNQVNGSYDLNSKQNIHMSANLDNSKGMLGDGVLDTTTGYAGILSGYNFGDHFTLCFWFKYKGPANPGVIYISNFNTYNHNSQYAVRVVLNNQGDHFTGIGVQYLVRGKDITNQKFRNKTPLAINKWYHVTIVVDIRKPDFNLIDILRKKHNNKTNIYINGNDDMKEIDPNFINTMYAWNNPDYNRFRNVFNSADLIYIGSLPEESHSKIRMDLLLVYRRDLLPNEIQAIYNIKGFKEEPFSTLENMTDNSQQCKGSYGQTIMDQSPEYKSYTCPPEKPACKGFVENESWGICSETTVNMKAVNQCAYSFWDHNDKTDPVKCPWFQPYCAGHVGGVHFGQCYSMSNKKYFDPDDKF